MPEDTDEALAERARQDTQAFGELVERYQHRIYGLIYRMIGNAEDAHDLAQDTFWRAYRGLGTFQTGRKFAPWLYRIAVNLSLDYRRRPTLAPLPESIETDGPSPEAVAVSREQQRRVQQAILGLPPKYRAAIVLRYVQELSYEEMATALDLPVNTVRTHLFRAREALRKALQDELR